jgi:hypothetical protein
VQNLPVDRNKFLEEMKDLYERVFSTDDGKRVLQDIVVCGKLKVSCFSTDPLTMAFNEGKRDLAQNIIDLATRIDDRKPRAIKAKR